MNRAYGVFQFRAVDDETRIVEGVANTLAVDDFDSILEPMGARFTLPMPLLWQHRTDCPVGEVLSATVTQDKITVRCRIASIAEPGVLQDLVNQAWHAVKYKLVKGLSVGFKPEKTAGGSSLSDPLRFVEWAWRELSLVTLPANTEATITAVRSADAVFLAASGETRPGVSGTATRTLFNPRRTMTIAEQIAQHENSRAAMVARRTALLEAAAADGNRTLDASEAEEHDTLEQNVRATDEHLVRLRALERDNAAAAQPVPTTPLAPGQRSDTRGGGGGPVVRVNGTLDPGIEFARFAMCVAAAKGDVGRALNLAQTHYPQQTRAISVLRAAQETGQTVERYIGSMAEMMSRAAVPAGTTTDATWAAPLVAYNQFAGDFIEYLRPRTIIGQFGQNGIPELRRIPFNVHIRGQTSGGAGYWVGQGKATPVTKFDFNDTYHGFTKLGAIAVLEEELIRFSNPSAERLVRDALGGAIIERADTDFINPASAAVAGVRPASITNGVVPGSASGTDGEAVLTDLGTLWTGPLAARLPLTSAVYITSPLVALRLSLMVNPLGQKYFPEMTMMGGKLNGVPAIVSDYVPAATLVLAFASEIWLSDDGDVTVDASREASIQMLDNPTNDSDTPTPTTVVSMYQDNSVALRAVRFMNWSKRRNSAVAVLEDIAWGTTPVVP